jgi:DEAD/DEAH box helicase domain-containing protein
MAGYENLDSGELESGHLTEAAKRRYCLVTDPGGKTLPTVNVNPETGECFGQRTGTKLFRAPCPEHGEACNDTSACVQQQCPQCETLWSSSDQDEEDDDRDLKIQPLRGAERLGVGVVAETALYGMPVFPDDSRNWKPGAGRRLLCFSDSRREAARLGPLLTRQHEVQVVRAAISNSLLTAKPPSIEYTMRRIPIYQADAEDPSLSQGDRDEATRQLGELTRQLSYATLGLPVFDFARILAKDPRIHELVDRDLAEKHSSAWRQQYWEDNAASVASHTEALIGAEMDNPLRTASSIEAAGLVELVYPGLENVSLPAAVAGLVTDSNARHKLSIIWPDLLAALVDTARADRTVEWSQDTEGRKWDGQSPLYGRWATRRKNGWTARRFIGDDPYLRDPHRQHLIQSRLWFVSRVLRAVGALETLSVPVLESVFDQLYDSADRQAWPWLRSKPHHEVKLGESDQAIQILFDHLRLRKLAKLFRCPDTGTLWPRSVLGYGSLRDVGAICNH